MCTNRLSDTYSKGESVVVMLILMLMDFGGALHKRGERTDRNYLRNTENATLK